MRFTVQHDVHEFLTRSYCCFLPETCSDIVRSVILDLATNHVNGNLAQSCTCSVKWWQVTCLDVRYEAKKFILFSTVWLNYMWLEQPRQGFNFFGMIIIICNVLRDGEIRFIPMLGVLVHSLIRP